VLGETGGAELDAEAGVCGAAALFEHAATSADARATARIDRALVVKLGPSDG
jgi:hypothetical protein